MPSQNTFPLRIAVRLFLTRVLLLAAYVLASGPLAEHSPDSFAPLQVVQELPGVGSGLAWYWRQF